MKARIHVTLKPGVLDPQGKAVRHALTGLGFTGIEELRLGKYIEIDLGGADAKTAQDQVTAMCDKLLANPVIENYRIELSAS